jgi:hypothetical protein
VEKIVKKYLSIFGLFLLALALVAACEPYGTTTVGEVELTGQTSSVSATTFYTPGADGDFLVTIYLSCGTGSGTSFNVYVGYTDEYRAYSAASSPIQVGGSSNGQTQYEYVVHAASGQPFQYATIYSGGTSACDTFIKVIKI